jgi:hypothetical protein
MKEKLKQLEETALIDGVTFSSAFANKLNKNMPKDKVLGGILEHCDIESIGPNVKATFHDGESPFAIRGKKYKGVFAPFRKLLRRILSKKKESMKVIVNRSRLKLLLETIDKICSSNTQEVIFIEFTDENDLILRAVNSVTNQRILATMKSYRYNEKDWLKHDRWEQKLTGENKKKYFYKRR